MSKYYKLVLLAVLFAFASTTLVSASANTARVYSLACVGSKRSDATWYQQVTCARYNSRGVVVGRLPVFFTLKATVRNTYYYRSVGMGKSLLLKSEWVIQ